MDHESKAFFPLKEMRGKHSLTRVYMVRLQQLEPLSGINKGRFLTAKSKS